MGKDKYFRLKLTIEHETDGLTNEQQDDFFMELLTVADKYGLSCVGMLKPTDEDGFHMDRADDMKDIIS